MSALPVSEARATLPHLLDLVEQGEEITITRHGRPVAVLIGPDQLRVRRAGAALELADEIGRLLEHGRRTPISATTGLSGAQVDELLGEVRAGRERRG